MTANGEYGFKHAYQGFPLNAWYVAAFSHELGDKPLVRRICGDLVVMFRTANGEAVALLDRCPHRATPLSMGTVVGNAIQCGYHGMEFGPGGKCVKIPSQARIPERMKARAYPIAEIWKWIWIWPGDPEKADPALIPDHHELKLTDKSWNAMPQFIVPMSGSAEMLHENLLDTTHITFLHKGAFDSGGMATTEPKMEIKGNAIRVWRELEETATAMTARSFEIVEGVTYKRSLITEARVPHLEIVSNVFEDPAGREATRIRTSVIAVTPGGPQLCYQINTLVTNYGSLRTMQFKSAEAQQMIERVKGVIHQDRDMIGAIQANYAEAGDEIGEVSVHADKAALEFRRKMVEMINAERNAAAARATRSAG